MKIICIKVNNINVLDNIELKLNNTNFVDLVFKRNRFKIYSNIFIAYKGNKIDDFFKFISKIISENIILNYEILLVKRILNTQYFYFDEYDKQNIIKEFKIIKTKERNKIDYKIIQNELIKYIYENKILILDGFVNFRLQRYIQYLENILSSAVNQYIVNKEYMKFVNLLKNYVVSKIPNDKTVNLIYINSEGILLDENGEFLKLDSFDTSYMSDINFSKNDYILNTLIGILPKKIELHLISKEDQFIKTIKLIFENKIHICCGCSLCNAYKMLSLK